MEEKKEKTLDDKDSSVYGCNMFGICGSRDAAVEEKMVLLIDPTRAESEDSVTFNGPALNEMNGRTIINGCVIGADGVKTIDFGQNSSGLSDDNEQEHNNKKNKTSAGKMGLSHLRATITRAKQMAGQGFPRAIEDIIPGFLLAKKRVFSGHKCRIKNASDIPFICITKDHWRGHLMTRGAYYGITRRWMQDHELMPGNHIDVPSALFKGISEYRTKIHVYPRIAGEYPFDMHGYGEHKIIYPNGVKAMDVAGSIDCLIMKGPYDVSISWKGKVIVDLLKIRDSRPC